MDATDSQEFNGEGGFLKAEENCVVINHYFRMIRNGKIFIYIYPSFKDGAE